MILLELTPQEAELVQNGLLKEKSLWEDPEKNWGNRTSAENNANRCAVILDKLLVAEQPQEQAVITFRDLFLMISNAKSQYLALPLDLHISNKKVEEVDFKHIALANALIMWLNGNSLLKKLARFDYTDNSNQYEELE